MRSRIRALLTVAGLVLCLNVVGQQQKNDPCDNASTTYETVLCQKQQMAQLETRLEAVLSSLAKKLETAKERALLDKSQLAWRDYREAFCQFEASAYEGGTIMPLIYGECWIAVTKSRIKELQELQEHEPYK